MTDGYLGMTPSSSGCASFLTRAIIRFVTMCTLTELVILYKSQPICSPHAVRLARPSLPISQHRHIVTLEQPRYHPRNRLVVRCLVACIARQRKVVGERLVCVWYEHLKKKMNTCKCELVPSWAQAAIKDSQIKNPTCGSPSTTSRAGWHPSLTLNGNKDYI